MMGADAPIPPNWDRMPPPRRAPRGGLNYRAGTLDWIFFPSTHFEYGNPSRLALGGPEAASIAGL